MTTRILPALLAFLLCACAGAPARDGQGGATFVVVRHAEKTSDTERDPDLSAAGVERAQRLAALLQGDDVVAVYATGYRRTQQTALPTAQAHALATATYDAAGPAADLAMRLKAAHPSGTVLVVGHSNTVPGIVAALCDCDTEPMPETEYDRVSTVSVDGNGGTRLQVTRFGAGSAAAP